MRKERWELAKSARRPDTIISSLATKRKQNGFTPTYLKEPNNMYFMLSNEYTRMWLKERGIYEETAYLKYEVEGNWTGMERRYVQHYSKPNKRFTRVMPIITLKRLFSNIAPKVSCRSLKEKDKETKKANEKIADEEVDKDQLVNC
ncbi:hypothetical protein FQA39_LY04982 [Lamprigera yunnana]|nr:hypothetical protein FQA39_LY04982 [Lamprigera yunnana]